MLHSEFGVWARCCEPGEQGDCRRAEKGGTVHFATDPGNDVAGHNYGQGLRFEEKKALVAYLMTL